MKLLVRFVLQVWWHSVNTTSRFIRIPLIRTLAFYAANMQEFSADLASPSPLQVVFSVL